MSDKTDITPKPVRMQDLMPPDVDASAVLSEHMHNFVYGNSPHLDSFTTLPDQNIAMVKNSATLADIERKSGNVRDDLQNHAVLSAEREQRTVVGMADRLDLNAISSAISGATRGGSAGLVNALKFAGATPLVERVRLGAIQLRQNHESDAEHTFEDASKVDIARESRTLPEVMALKCAAQSMYEELKLKRTLPESFDANLALIDKGVKDGSISKEELISSQKSPPGDRMTKTLIEYLLKNFDQIKNSNEGIDHTAVVNYQQKIMPRGFAR
ncbi:MAG: hypothetical protein JST89_26750 [Cyanobacteria bacterium SZAS-4]|nr:hypothetical protein [Cyanobacteria bacterium SZAS-4]